MSDVAIEPTTEGAWPEVQALLRELKSALLPVL